MYFQRVSTATVVSPLHRNLANLPGYDEGPRAACHQRISPRQTAKTSDDPQATLRHQVANP